MSQTILLNSLAGIRRRVRLLSLVHGLGLLLAAILGLLLATVCLDYLLNLPAIPRLVVILGALAGMAYAGSRFLLRPMLSRLRLTDVAGRVEEAFPAFDDRLRSAVGFSAAKNNESEAMKRRVVAQAESLAGNINLGGVLRPQPAWHAAGLGAAAMLICMLIAIWMGPEYLSVAMGRLLSPFSANPWPKRTEIAMVSALPTRVAAGTSVEVRIKLVKGDRKSAKALIFYQYEKGGPVQQEMMSRNADGSYSANLDARIEPGKTAGEMAVWMKSGDDDKNLPAIAVVPQLTIKQVEAVVTPPKYADLPPVTLDMAAAAASVTQGSGVELKVGFNKPLATGSTIRVEPASADTIAPDVKWDPIALGSNMAVGHFMAQKPVHFKLLGTDQDNFTNSGIEEYQILVKPDQLPTVQFEKPVRNEEALAAATIPLQAVASDDFGIKVMQLMVRRLGDNKNWTIDLVKDSQPTGGQTESNPLVQWAKIDSTGDLRRFRMNWDWELSQLDGAALKAGDQLEFYLRVQDNYEDDQGRPHDPPYSESGRLRVTVISLEQLTQQLSDQLAQLREQVDDTRRQNEGLRAGVKSLAEDTKTKPALDRADRQMANQLANDQSAAASQTRQIADKLGEVLARIQQNQPANGESAPALRDLAANAAEAQRLLNDAAQNPMRQAATNLSDLATRQNGAPSDMPANVQNPDNQQTPADQQPQQPGDAQAQANPSNNGQPQNPQNAQNQANGQSPDQQQNPAQANAQNGDQNQQSNPSQPNAQNGQQQNPAQANAQSGQQNQQNGQQSNQQQNPAQANARGGQQNQPGSQQDVLQRLMEKRAQELDANARNGQQNQQGGQQSGQQQNGQANARGGQQNQQGGQQSAQQQNSAQANARSGQQNQQSGQQSGQQQNSAQANARSGQQNQQRGQQSGQQQNTAQANARSGQQNQQGGQQSGQQQNSAQANARSGQQNQQGGQQSGQQQSGQQQSPGQQQQQQQALAQADSRNAALDQTQQQQATATQQLQQAMDKMGTDAGLSRYLKQVAALLDAQRQLSQQTTTASKDLLGKPAAQLNDQEKKTVNDLAQQQQDLAKQTDQAINQMKQASDQQARTDPTSAQALQQAAQTGQQQNVSGNMNQAGQAEQQNQQANAQQGQRQAELGLMMMTRQLKDAENRRLMELMKQLDTAQQLVADLLQQQAGHNLDNLMLQGGSALSDATKSDPELIKELIDYSGRDATNLPKPEGMDTQISLQAQTERNTRNIVSVVQALPEGTEPAADLTRAAQRMSRAVTYLQDGSLTDAYQPPQVEAFAALLSAKETVDKQNADTQQRIQDQQKETLRQQFVSIRADQQKLNDQVKEIDHTTRTADGQLGHTAKAALGLASDAQKELSKREAKLDDDLSAAGSIVYTYANDDIVVKMDGASKLLAKLDPGTTTQASQARIVRQLDDMIKNLTMKPRQSQFANTRTEQQPQNPRQPGQPGQQPPPAPKLPPEAEIRLVQDMQKLLNEDTKDAAAATPADKAVALDLGRRQGDLRKMLDDLLQKVSDGKITLGDEPDNKDTLPEEATSEDLDLQELKDAALNAKPDEQGIKDDTGMLGIRMSRARQRLALNADPGTTTQKIQDRIVVEMDGLASMAQQQQTQAAQAQRQRQQRQGQQRQGQPRPGQQGNPNNGLAQGQQNPADQQANRPNRQGGNARGNTTGRVADDPNGTLDQLKETWGKLSPRQRSAVMELNTDQTIQKFKDFVDGYYRTLATKEAQTPAAP